MYGSRVIYSIVFRVLFTSIKLRYWTGAYLQYTVKDLNNRYAVDEEKLLRKASGYTLTSII